MDVTMANKITETEIIPTDALVDSLSRYTNSTVLYYGNNGLMTFSIYKRQVTPSDPTQDQYTVISPSHEYRPDKLAYQVYGAPDLWWKIMEANGIYDIWDFKAGLNIRLPSDSNVF
jgi:hypothetical protein